MCDGPVLGGLGLVAEFRCWERMYAARRKTVVRRMNSAAVARRKAESSILKERALRMMAWKVRGELGRLRVKIRLRFHHT